MGNRQCNIQTMSTPASPPATIRHDDLAAVRTRRVGEVFTEDDVEAARQRVLACLDAKKPVWNNKAGTVSQWIPDDTVSLKAAEIVLSYGIGTPVQRVLHSNASVTDPAAELAACLASEAGQEALALVLAKHPQLLAQHAPPARAGTPTPAPSHVVELPLFDA